MKWISPTAASAMVEQRPSDALPKGFRVGVALDALAPSLSDLARAKLQPCEPAQTEGMVWPKTAADWAVVLPRHVPDFYLKPEYLFAEFDAHRLPKERSLAMVTTVDFPDALTRHDCLRAGRLFAEWLAAEMQLASLVVLHVPADAGHQSIDIHCHVLTPCRTLAPTGWGALPTKLLGRKGPDFVHARWMALTSS